MAVYLIRLRNGLPLMAAKITPDAVVLKACMLNIVLPLPTFLTFDP